MNKKTSSIAIRLNLLWTFRKFKIYIFMDMLALIVCVGCWCYCAETDFYGEFQFNAERNFHGDEFIQSLSEEDRYDAVGSPQEVLRHVTYVVSYPGRGAVLEKSVGNLTQSVFFFGKIIISLEGLGILFTLFFGVSDIRRKLKPLDDMAKLADELGSRMQSDENTYVNLENAIAHVMPDGQEQVLSTGNKDLEGVEMAINNLLARMRESYRQQSRFVSDASHELRTPIAVIQGYADMLDRWGKEDSQVLEESIQAIKHESNHMKTLIEQLLFLARGDAGRNQLNMEEISLKSIIHEVYEESKMIDENHRYEIVESEDDVIMTGDAAMIKQSVRILVDNAAKYTKEGESIILKSGVDVKMQPFFMIQDNGTGMNENDVEHIFERFYRSDKARSSQTGGTGLGLSIAKWIIDRHGGYFDVLSRSELGTRFTVTFKRNENLR